MRACDKAGQRLAPRSAYLTLLFFCAACGGGGGGSASAVPQPENRALVWGQGSWGQHEWTAPGAAKAARPESDPIAAPSSNRTN